MKPQVSPRWRRVVVVLIAAALLHLPVVPAAVPAARADDSTIIQISKSTIYGGLLGLLLGGAVAIVVEDDRDEPIRWGLVLGVFGGFAYGVYAASTGRDEFFHQDGLPFEPARYRLSGSADALTTDPAAHATPLFQGRDGRSEFSPFSTPAAE